jgi:hypothetical protein
MDHPEAFPIAVKNSPRSNHKFVTFLYNIVNCLTGNASFTNPTPTAAQIKDTADNLGAANAKAKNGGPLAVADRDAKRADAEKLLDQYVIYVRVNVKGQAGDPATAAAMILSSGLSVKKYVKPQKPQLAAKYGTVSGQVLLVALAVAKSAMYMWEYSLNLKDWVSVPQTMQADTIITGLTPGQTYYFRFRAQTRKGLGDYSQVVSLLVH